MMKSSHSESPLYLAASRPRLHSTVCGSEAPNRNLVDESTTDNFLVFATVLGICLVLVTYKKINFNCLQRVCAAHLASLQSMPRLPDSRQLLTAKPQGTSCK